MSRGEMNNRVSERLKFLITTLKITYKEFAEKTGIPYRTLQNYLLGQREPSLQSLQKIATRMGVNINWLLTGEGEPFQKAEIPEDAIPVRKIPVFGRVPAGFPNFVAEEVVEYIYLPDAPQNAYAVIAKGDSMSPVIKDGDYVLFIPMPVEVKNGDIVLVNNEWGETMIKRYREKDGEVYLVSDNPEYPTFKPNSQYKILGKVISVWRKIKI